MVYLVAIELNSSDKMPTKKVVLVKLSYPVLKILILNRGIKIMDYVTQELFCCIIKSTYLLPNLSQNSYSKCPYLKLFFVLL